MIAIATIATIWTALIVLVIGACFAARLGDEDQQEPSSFPSASRPDTHAARRHLRTAAFPGRLRSPQHLSTR
jgi:hypothetical protein